MVTQQPSKLLFRVRIPLFAPLPGRQVVKARDFDSRMYRFESCPGNYHARVAELADAPDSKSGG